VPAAEICPRMRMREAIEEILDERILEVREEGKRKDRVGMREEKTNGLWIDPRSEKYHMFY
jgi:hypothetical protein